MGNFSQYGSPIFRQLSDDQLQEVHFASLEILERTGVRHHLQEAVDTLKKAGARGFEDSRVCIPSHLVEWALKTVPKKWGQGLTCDHIITDQALAPFFPALPFRSPGN